MEGRDVEHCRCGPLPCSSGSLSVPVQSVYRQQLARALVRTPMISFRMKPWMLLLLMVPWTAAQTRNAAFSENVYGLEAGQCKCLSLAAAAKR